MRLKARFKRWKFLEKFIFLAKWGWFIKNKLNLQLNLQKNLNEQVLWGSSTDPQRKRHIFNIRRTFLKKNFWAKWTLKRIFPLIIQHDFSRLNLFSLHGTVGKVKSYAVFTNFKGIILKPCTVYSGNFSFNHTIKKT